MQKGLFFEKRRIVVVFIDGTHCMSSTSLNFLWWHRKRLLINIRHDERWRWSRYITEPVINFKSRAWVQAIFFLRLLCFFLPSSRFASSFFSTKETEGSE
jgi:hypothetical protein